MIELLKKIINENIIHIKCILSGLLNSVCLNKNLSKNDKKIFVYLSGFYQNLGDMAITYAHETFLKENFSEYKIVMIPSTQTYSTIRWVKKITNKEDIVTIVGGGNMDSSYASLENCRRFIFKMFKNNKIVSFPQTMSFENTPYGNYRLRKTKKSYNSHPNFHVFAREQNSYYNMKNIFTNARTVGLVPDMVLYLNFVNKFQCERNGALCVFRNDFEKACDFDLDTIHKLLEEKYGSVEDTDTVCVSKDACVYGIYDKTILDFLKKISSKRLVVTDRLHCMIFCVITGTPCVAFDNSNKKISGVYKAWLDNLNYIKVLECYDKMEFSDLISAYENFDFSLTKFEHYEDYDSIKACISD